LLAKWDQWKLALGFSLSFIDDSGLMNVTSPSDWLRFGMGGHNIEANAILHYTIHQGIQLAHELNDTAPIANWTATAARVKSAANALLWDEDAGMYKDNETTTLHPQDGNTWAVIANLTAASSQAERISSNLVERWTPYGAPALEAADAISPFISSFELQAHFLAANGSAALALMRLQWGFMLDDARMTNSTFIEGYSSTGELHYAPYLNDARISHAHGWGSGPTSSLTFYVAGVQLVSAGGKTWRIAPEMGGLKHVEAGFSTGLGMFAAKTEIVDGGVEMEFEAPQGTKGEMTLPVLACKGHVLMQEQDGRCEDIAVEVAADVGAVTVGDVEGGRWKVKFACTN
jgi:hypothetical protein